MSRVPRTVSLLAIFIASLARTKREMARPPCHGISCAILLLTYAPYRPDMTQVQPPRMPTVRVLPLGLIRN